MFGIRFLIIVAAIILAVVIIKRLLATPGDSRKPPATPANMVRCEQCGLYLPKDDAIRAGEHHFCSAEHRDDYGQR